MNGAIAIIQIYEDVDKTLFSFSLTFLFQICQIEKKLAAQMEKQNIVCIGLSTIRG